MAERWLKAFMASEGLPDGFHDTFEAVCVPLAERAKRLRQVRRKTVLMGLCGPQGSGKTTIALATRSLLEDRGLNAVVLSLDDFYLGREARLRLAKETHPLMATRGPPGTHDVAMMSMAIDQLRGAGRVVLPAFDKATDTRKPRGQWEMVKAPVDVILVEGWCVGAAAQGQAALVAPINSLEATEDADGRWRALVNNQLDGPYQTLFGKLHELVLLQAPSFDVVAGWRREQEAKLRARTGAGMNDAEVDRFVAHYERLSRWIAQEMPERAQWVVSLDKDRRPLLED